MSNIKDKIAPNSFISLTDKKNLPSKENRDPKMLDAARMFENQFLRQMITQMRRTVPESEFMPESGVQKFYKEQMDDQHAENWTQNGGIGLADMIYNQLQDKIDSKRMRAYAKQPGEVLPLKNERPVAAAPVSFKKTENEKSGLVDLISRRDKDMFMLKKTNQGLFIKSKDPLPEHVDVRVPMNGTVLQAAALGEGKQMVIVGHDQGLKTQYVHTGENLVQPGQVLIAGQALARLPASRQGEQASVVFGLRQHSTIE